MSLTDLNNRLNIIEKIKNSIDSKNFKLDKPFNNLIIINENLIKEILIECLSIYKLALKLKSNSSITQVKNYYVFFSNTSVINYVSDNFKKNYTSIMTDMSGNLLKQITELNKITQKYYKLILTYSMSFNNIDDFDINDIPEIEDSDKKLFKKINNSRLALKNSIEKKIGNQYTFIYENQINTANQQIDKEGQLIYSENQDIKLSETVLSEISNEVLKEINQESSFNKKKILNKKIPMYIDYYNQLTNQVNVLKNILVEKYGEQITNLKNIKNLLNKIKNNDSILIKNDQISKNSNTMINSINNTFKIKIIIIIILIIITFFLIKNL
jgi:hypothetical protein